MVIAVTIRRVENGGVNQEHVVLIVVYDEFQLLDLAGPLEVLSGATRFGASPAYR